MLALNRHPDPMPARAPGPASSPTVPLAEERAVVARIRQGDRAAFAILYRWYGDAVYRAAVSRIGDPVAAEDVLREAFRRALERLDDFAHVDRSIYWWIRRIAINLAMDHHRRRTREREVADRVRADPSLLNVPERPDRGLEVDDTARDVEISLSRLNPRYAQALRMRLLEDQSREACAEAFGVSVATFDVLLHRACKAFRNEYPP